MLYLKTIEGLSFLSLLPSFFHSSFFLFLTFLHSFMFFFFCSSFLPSSILSFFLFLTFLHSSIISIFLSLSYFPFFLSLILPFFLSSFLPSFIHSSFLLPSHVYMSSLNLCVCVNDHKDVLLIMPINVIYLNY